MRVFWSILMVAMLGLMGVGITGCDRGAEEAGENIDEAVDETGDNLRQAGDEIEDAVDDAADEVRDATN